MEAIDKGNIKSNYERTKQERQAAKLYYTQNAEILTNRLLEWFYNNFEKTTTTHYIKLKHIYEIYKESQLYKPLRNAEKRQNNYKQFIKRLKETSLNENLKRRSETYFLINYKEK